MARDRYKVVSDSPHFITCATVDWASVLRFPAAASIILDSLTFLQDKNSLTLFGYVLMENHIHLIASSPELAITTKRLKSYTAKEIIGLLEEMKMRSLLDRFDSKKTVHKKESNYQFWQEGYHPEMIIDREMMRQKLNYMHCNPVRRGYVDRPEHWRYSSARDYCGEKGIMSLVGKGNGEKGKW